jgi:CheY-like chemotaxis protein
MRHTPRILCIDDDESLLILLNKYLTPEFEVSTVINGQAALALLDKEKFDVIVSDIMMPDMTGYQLFEDVKRRFPTNSIPFLFLTALDKESDMLKGLNLGADDYLIKPFSLEILKLKIMTILSRYDQDQPNVIQGKIEELDLNSLIRQCSEKLLNGRIEMCSEGQKGSIFFERGEITDVECMELNSEEAIDYLLRWKSGHFSIYQELLEIESEAKEKKKDLESTKTTRQEKGDNHPGLLNRFKVKKHDFQIQTEYSKGKITSLIVLNGKVIKTFEKVVEQTDAAASLGPLMKNCHNRAIALLQKQLQSQKTTGEQPEKAGIPLRGGGSKEAKKPDKSSRHQVEHRVSEGLESKMPEATGTAVDGLIAGEKGEDATASLPIELVTFEQLLQEFVKSHKGIIAAALFDGKKIVSSRLITEEIGEGELLNPLWQTTATLNRIARMVSSSSLGETMMVCRNGCLYLLPVSEKGPFLLIVCTEAIQRIISRQLAHRLLEEVKRAGLGG